MDETELTDLDKQLFNGCPKLFTYWRRKHIRPSEKMLEVKQYIGVDIDSIQNINPMINIRRR